MLLRQHLPAACKARTLCKPKPAPFREPLKESFLKGTAFRPYIRSPINSRVLTPEGSAAFPKLPVFQSFLRLRLHQPVTHQIQSLLRGPLANPLPVAEKGLFGGLDALRVADREINQPYRFVLCAATGPGDSGYA